MPWALRHTGNGRVLMRIALLFVLLAIVITEAFNSAGYFLIAAALLMWVLFGGLGAPGLQTHIAHLSPTRRGLLMELAGNSMNLGVAGAPVLAASVYPFEGLCCINRFRDSLCESSMIAG